MKRYLVLGGPGAGKTERLLSIIEKEIRNGTPVERIAFVSFTRAAVEEAVDRCKKKFSLTDRDMSHFRTLHSMCYRQLGIQRSQVMDTRKLKEFGRSIGVKITGYVGEEVPLIEGDRLAFLVGLSGSTGRPLRDVWEEDGEVEWRTLEWFAKSLSNYKEANGLLDFTDMLIDYVSDGLSVDVDVAIVDEAQDLTNIQWRVVNRAYSSAKRIYVAGDDQQCIYEWSGADVRTFLQFDADYSEVLPQSHRLPKPIFDLAQDIGRRISDRYDKDWGPADHDGSISYIGDVGHLDLTQGDWLLLARNTYLLDRYSEECRSQGVPFFDRRGYSVDPGDVRTIMDHEALRRGMILSSERAEVVRQAIGTGDKTKIWHEAFESWGLAKRSYLLMMLRRGEDPRRKPRIRIDTIHGVKGNEAENVVVMMDVSKRSREEYERRPDRENRVLYVALTRARKNLYVILPQSFYTFDL
jgi:superfamily I DNA/RNA helicase